MVLVSRRPAMPAACPRQVPGNSPGKPATEEDALRPEVQRLSTEAEALLRVQNEAIWNTWTAGQQPRIAATYEGHQALFTLEAIQKIGRLRSLARDPAEVRALTWLLTHFTGQSSALNPDAEFHWKSMRSEVAKDVELARAAAPVVTP